MQYSLVDYEESGVDEVSPTAIVGKFGQFLSNNFAIEGRFGIGLQDDDVNVEGINIDVDVESLYGVYGVLQSEPANDTSFYGIIGYTRGEIEASAFGVSISDTETDLSFGIGVNIGHLNIEYMNYFDEDDFDATAISIGYVSSFD